MSRILLSGLLAAGLFCAGIAGQRGLRVLLLDHAAKVGEKIFSNGTRAAPYAGVPTFVSAPYRQVDQRNPEVSDLDVAIVGVPMDLGVTNRPGSRFGPRALRAIDRIGPYNHVLECAPVFDLKVADIGDVPFSSRYRLEMSHDDIEAYHTKLVAQGVLPDHPLPGRA